MKANRQKFPLLLIYAIVISIFCEAQTQSISGVVNNYYKVLGINMTRSMLKVDNSSYLLPGQRGILIQMKGASVDQSNPSSNSNWGTISSIGNAGKFELVRVCAVQDDSAVLETQIQNTYDITGQVQLVIFPDHPSVRVVDSVMALPWDSVTGKGGIVFIHVPDTVYLQDDIVATGRGFKGAVYTDFPQGPYGCTAANFTSYAFNLPASGNSTGGKKGEGIARHIANLEYGKARLGNGGGGGNNHNAGGGGGGNWGVGGIGGVRARVAAFGCVGNNPGLGAVSVSSYFSGPPDRLFMGGGGGAGQGNNDVGMHGGNGGGIIFIKCSVLSGNGKHIFANGAIQHRVLVFPPYTDTTIADSDGGSGGGGGGSIVIYANNVINGLSIESKGGKGGNNEWGGNNNCMGPGGGGGGGVVWFYSSSTPSGVTTNTNGGLAGTRVNGNPGGYCDGYPNGATDGGAGTVLYNFFFTPADTTFLCSSLLPVSWLINFRAVPSGESVYLSWTVTDNLANLFVVEKSYNASQFTPIEQVVASGRTEYTSIRDWEDVICYYRIRAIGQNGQVKYSRIIRVNGKEGNSQVKLYPNPIDQKIRASVVVTKAQVVRYTISDVSGRILLSGKRNLVEGNQQVFIDAELLPGIYQLRLAGESFYFITSFTRL